jgi:hypothetical protein
MFIVSLVKWNNIMKFYVDYEDKEGDLCHVWVNASSKQEAEAQA